MLKKYNFSAELMVLANSYFKQGRKKEAAKLAYRALAEEDSQELVDTLDDMNQELDPTAEEEVLSDGEIDEIVEEVEEPVEEPAEEVEAEGEECEECQEEVEAEGEDAEEAPAEEQLPEVEEVLSKLKAKKATLANLASINGKKASRRKAIARFLK